MKNFYSLVIKNLIYGLNRKSGRNNQGKITVRHRGGMFYKRKIRFIDYWRFMANIPAIVLIPQIYDPLKTFFLSLILYKNGIFSFIVKPRFLEQGDIIKYSTKTIPPQSGNSCNLRIVPDGLYVNNVSLTLSNKFVYGKSAGCYLFIINKFCTLGNKVLIRLPSKEEYLVNCNNLCNVGRIDNIDHRYKRYTKAGQLRRKGKRPYVRGVAMNPIDHPHGGNTSIGRQPISIWARTLSKGGRTRKLSINRNFIFHRRI